MAESIKRATALAQHQRAAAVASKPEPWSGPRREPADWATWCLLAEVPGQPVAVLQWLTPSVRTLAQALRCTPGDALRVVAGMVDAGTLKLYRVQGPNQYAALVTDATVWRRAEPGQVAGFVSRPGPAPEALPVSSPATLAAFDETTAAILRSLAVKPVAAEDWQPARPALTAVQGRAGLVRLLRQAADWPAWAALLDKLAVAVGVDEWAALLSVQAQAGPVPTDAEPGEQQPNSSRHLQAVPELPSLLGLAKVGQARVSVSYSDDEVQRLVNAASDELKSGKHGYRGRILARWETLMPGRAKPFPQSLGRSLARAEANGIKPSNTAVSSVFNLGNGSAIKNGQKRKSVGGR